MDLELTKDLQVAAIVLTYHPTSDVCQNCDEILKQVHHIYLVNNEVTSSSEQVLAHLSQNEKITFINFTENLGVATGFNAGIKQAIADGFSYMILFDQDSAPAVGMVSKLLASHQSKNDVVGIIGPKLQSRKTGRFFDSTEGLQEQDLIISSGSLFSKALIEDIGLLEDSYFIDYVDHEYSLRAKRFGKQNFIDNSAILVHQFGDPAIRNLFGRSVVVSNYSPIRHYYMARNRIFLLKKYGCKDWFWADFLHFLKTWLKVFVFEDLKIQKVFAFLRGVRDGMFDRR